MGSKLVAIRLGTGSFTVYSLEKRGARPHLTTVLQKQCLSSDKGGTADGTFKYISGVKLDDNSEMWICDATGRSIQVSINLYMVFRNSEESEGETGDRKLRISIFHAM